MPSKQKINAAKRTFWLFGGAILLFASYWSIRIALADFLYRQNTISSLTTAVSLAEGNAEYHALLAEHLEGVGTDPDPQFLIAAALSPSDARYWIRLGFSAELKGNYGAAEQYLLHAAAVNRKFDPAWALMNFYFRRDQKNQFWFWADKALAMSYGDVSPVYRLLWDMSGDSELIRSHIPSQPIMLSGYLSFLESNGHGEAAGRVAKDLASEAQAVEVPVLLQYCQNALSADSGVAIDVWNRLCSRKLLPLAPMNVSKGQIIPDPDFAFSLSSPGYGWQVVATEGITVGLAGDVPGIRIRLSGNQPEDCLIIQTVLPVLPEAEYRIRYEATVERDSAVSGLEWDIVSMGTGGATLSSSLFTPGSSNAATDFGSHAESKVRLRLRYHRPLGSTRARGALVIRSAHSEIAR